MHFCIKQKSRLCVFISADETLRIGQKKIRHWLCLYREDELVSHSFHLQDEKRKKGASLVTQWLRIRLPMKRTRVRALVREDPTCRRATKPVRHNY